MTTVDRAPADGASGNRARSGSRGRDRRNAWGDLLAALAAHVRAGRDQFALRAEFEQRVRDILRIRTVRLREESATYEPVPTVSEVGGDRVCLDVATRSSASRVLLEARCGPRAMEEWGYQLLTMAAHLAALLVDVDQRRLPGERPSKTVAPGPPPLVGSSAVMRGLRERIARVAATDFTVLVEGESGTGKELVARQLHALSRRRHGPFVAVNCAAIVDTLLEAELFGIEERTATGVRGRRGKFEHADGGTLFLDEVADLAPAAQAKLLRALQELTVERVGGNTPHHVDTRIVVATNRSLRELVARGVFREDLYYRLSGVELHVPPLRSRREDIATLASYFLMNYRTARPLALSAEAAQALATYDWPGNVRELERTLEGAVTAARGDAIGVEDLPPAVRRDFNEVVWPSLTRGDTMRAWGCRYAQLVLERCEGNKRRACDLLDISYHTLQSYLREKPWHPPHTGEDRAADSEGEESGDTAPSAQADAEMGDSRVSAAGMADFGASTERPGAAPRGAVGTGPAGTPRALLPASVSSFLPAASAPAATLHEQPRRSPLAP